jgi:RNAse (barnase) inhibitor barstar
MYTLVIQRFGKNGFKEASYKEKYDLLGQLNSSLLSPFKNVPDINIKGLQPNMVQEKLKEMVAQGIDDYLEYKNLEVQNPYTYVKGLDQGDNNTIYIYGITNLNPGNIIKIIWDSEQQVSEKDFAINTHLSVVTQGSNYTNLWNVKFTTDIQNLPVGIRWVDITAKNKTSRISFRVYEIDKPQIAPPLMKIRYLDGGIVVTPTPKIVEVRVPYEVTVIQTVVIPTPTYPNDAFGVVYNPYKQQNTDNYIVPLLFIGLALIILRGKLWK